MFIILILITLLSLIVSYFYVECRRPKNYPPGPNWLPIVGNTPELRKTSKLLGGQHLVFEKWMTDYNSPVIGLKLGGEYVVVALTYPLVRTIHTNAVYDGRPDNFFLRLRNMGTRLGITFTDGPLWAEQRNFTVRHLREAGYGRQPMELQIQSELIDLLKIIGDFNESSQWPGGFLPPSVINVLWTFTAGKPIPRDDVRLIRLINLMRERSRAFDMSGGLLNQYPFLRYIAPEFTGFSLINRLNKELYDFFMESIAEHKRDLNENNCNDDLIYAFLNEMNNTSDSNTTFTELQLVMNILDIFIAGSQTTSITLDLALMAMVLYPNIQRNVQFEIDNKLNRLPTLNDRNQLPYTEAVLMEVQRFYNIVPITGPRRTLHPTELGGYLIPENTTILIGLRSVLMDKCYWGDPEIFRPERFLNDQKEIVNTEYFMPFGQGKRRCLGDQLARACLFSFFTGILQKYTVSLESNQPTPSNNLQPGITLSPTPYKVVFRDRKK